MHFDSVVNTERDLKIENVELGIFKIIYEIFVFRNKLRKIFIFKS